MYINSLGAERAERTPSFDYSIRTANTNTNNNTSGTTGTGKTGAASYASAMQKALTNQTTPLNYSNTWAGNIIIREALEKMKEDPEWEASVMSKIKEETQTDYEMTQSGLQSYMMQMLVSGATNGSNFSNYLGYSPYLANTLGYTNNMGLGALASS
ncbi:MAG: hypothetical protein K2J04_12080, partial [Lachnospiraceae bacterium]|nr:hypothetical protein [Lachnospiraceae bacterium]